MRIGRNDPCPCGSGKKYKKCCLGRSVCAPYLECHNPLSGDVMWRFNCPGLVALNLIPQFLDAHRHDGYSLSVFDTVRNWSGIEVLNVPFEDMVSIIAFIYHTEHAEPIEWIGVNSLSDSYVVAMPLLRGRIGGHYRAVNGKLESIGAVNGMLGS